MLPSFRTFALDSQLIVVPPRQPRSVKLSQPAGFGEFGFLPMPQIQPGFEVLLVDPRQTKHAPGRPKTDVVDCQCARPEKILDRASLLPLILPRRPGIPCQIARPPRRPPDGYEISPDL